jgi:hypothetical protein
VLSAKPSYGGFRAGAIAMASSLDQIGTLQNRLRMPDSSFLGLVVVINMTVMPLVKVQSESSVRTEGIKSVYKGVFWGAGQGVGEGGQRQLKTSRLGAGVEISLPNTIRLAANTSCFSEVSANLARFDD